MTMYAALLRGINVSGHKKVPMAELRTLLTELGHGDVRTHLQSGNAVFSSASDDENALAAELERAIEKRFGFPVPCLVRDGGYLAAVAAACPFPAAELEGKRCTSPTTGSRSTPTASPGSTRRPSFPRSSGSATARSTSTPPTDWAVPDSPMPCPGRPSPKASSPPRATGTPWSSWWR